MGTRHLYIQLIRQDMKRRQILVGTGAALSLSGCLGISAKTPNETSELNQSTNSKAEESEMAKFKRTVSVIDMDTVPKEEPVEYDINIVDNQINKAGSALVSITAKNAGDSTHTVLPFYKGRSAAAGDPGILLYELTSSDSPSEEYKPECINNPSPTQDKVFFTTELYAPEIKPGKTKTYKYIITDDPSVHGCIPTGEYRFEKDQVFDTPDDRIEFTWGFTLQITNS